MTTIEQKRAQNREKQKRYAQRHPDRVKALLTKWRAENPEKMAKQHRAWIQANRNTHNAVCRAWRKANPDKIREQGRRHRAAHRERVLAYSRKWCKAHPAKNCEHAARRRALLLGVFVEKVDRAEVYARDGGKCHLCGKKVNPRGWHLDHLIPLSRGGEHSYRNVAVSHAACNIRKGTGKLPSQLRAF